MTKPKKVTMTSASKGLKASKVSKNAKACAPAQEASYHSMKEKELAQEKYHKH